MNYKQTLDYLFTQLPMYQRVGAAAYKVDLSNTYLVCELLSNPEKKFKSVHVGKSVDVDAIFDDLPPLDLEEDKIKKPDIIIPQKTVVKPNFDQLREELSLDDKQNHIVSSSQDAIAAG